MWKSEFKGKEQSLSASDGPSIRKWIYPLLFIPCFFIQPTLDNDAYWLIASGRYALAHGIPYTEPLTFHEGLDFVMQQWLTASLYASIYDNLGLFALLGLIFILFVILVFQIYKFTLYLSNDNPIVAYVTTTLATIACYSFMTARPYPISLNIFMIEIFCLEKWIRTHQIKWLLPIPILSILLINMHAALWPFMFIIMGVYIVDCITTALSDFRAHQSQLSQIIAIFFISFFLGFVNPYGLDAMTYLFRSYGSSAILDNIMEMQPLALDGFYGIAFFSIAALIIFLFIKFETSPMHLRQLLLLFGTLVMALSSIRSLSLFAVCGVPMLAQPFGLYRPKRIIDERTPKWFYAVIVASICLILIAFIAFRISGISKDENQLPIGAINYVEKTYSSREDQRLYTDYNIGGFAEYHGLQPFIDARAEVFLKKNNSRADILVDFVALQSGVLYYTDFIDKYNLEIFIVSSTDILYTYLQRDPDYRVSFRDGDYAVIVKNKN